MRPARSLSRSRAAAVTALAALLALGSPVTALAPNHPIPDFG
ncbi:MULTISPECIES: hypothetical protein [unclassified Streptomyces]